MGTLLRRLWYLVRHRQLDADLVEEIEAHRAMAQATLEQNGADRDEAALAARRALGNELSARTRSRDVWIWPWLQDITQDLRFALRLLIKDPGFAVTAIVALGIGIGVNGAMFAAFNAYCLAGLPIERSDRVIHIGTRDDRAQERGVSHADLDDLARASSTTMSSIAAFAMGSVSVGDEGRTPDRFLRAHLSASAFALVGARPFLGRDFRPEDDRFGAAPTVILGHRVWVVRYAGDPTILGRSILLNGMPATVIGVMPEGFQFPNRAELWQPLSLMAGLQAQPRDTRDLRVFARLTDRTSVAQADAELRTISARLADRYPSTNTGIHLIAEPINAQYNADLTQPAWAAFVTVGLLIVLIACANVGNLLLTRSVSRLREIAIRASLGATRRRVVRQLLVESAVIALLGSLLGLAIARLGVIAWTMATPEIGIPFSGFTLDRFVLSVLAGVSCATVLVFGLAPALLVSRTDVNRVLKDGGRGSSSGPSSRRWTGLFLTAELAVTVLLLVQVGVSYRSHGELRRIDERIDAAPLLTASLSLPVERYATPDARRVFHERLAERLSAIGEVESFEVAGALPLAGALQQQLELEGQADADDQIRPVVRTLGVGPRYFETLRLPVLRGRPFDDRDGRPGVESAVVNQRFVELVFPGQEAIGRRIRVRRDASATPSPWLTIVGVAPSVRQVAVNQVLPIVYLPFRATAPATAALIVRSATDPGTLTSRLREEVRALDADLPLYRVMTMAEAMAEADWPSWFSEWLIRLITCVALGMSGVGLYAVVAHAVGQRTAEFGMRLALGARPGNLRSLVLRRAGMQGAVGVMAGLALALVWQHFFFDQGSGTGGIDLILMAPVCLGVAIVVMVASVAPIRRAMLVDPVVALRQE